MWNYLWQWSRSLNLPMLPLLRRGPSKPQMWNRNHSGAPRFHLGRKFYCRISWFTSYSTESFASWGWPLPLNLGQGCSHCRRTDNRRAEASAIRSTGQRSRWNTRLYNFVSTGHSRRWRQFGWFLSFCAPSHTVWLLWCCGHTHSFSASENWLLTIYLSRWSYSFSLASSPHTIWTRSWLTLQRHRNQCTKMSWSKHQSGWVARWSS